jgi:hypothetical protein
MCIYEATRSRHPQVLRYLRKNGSP